MTRDDHGENSTRDACPDLSEQADRLLHDLLHGKHDEALHDATGRTGDEIECVYIHEDESDPDEGWDVYAYVHMTIEFLEAPPWMDLPERTEVRANFVLHAAGYSGDGPDGELDRCTLLGVRYDVWTSQDGRGEMRYCFEKAEPTNQDPPAPAPINSTPVACDIDLPF